MSFIDNTYFVRDIDIPSTTVLDLAKTEAITRYEPEILKSLLGYKEYMEMMEAYTASIANTPVSLPEKWDNFINGSEFEFELNGETITEYWNGIKNSLKQSLIAYYVYFKYRSETATSNSGIGEIKPKPENAINASPRKKMVDAWNNMVELYGEVDYTFGLPYSNSSYVHFNDKPSAYNFLLSNLADYPNWRFKAINRINIWGF